jgi:ABC-type branched-subunit amino acid transport system ATPase component
MSNPLLRKNKYSAGATGGNGTGSPGHGHLTATDIDVFYANVRALDAVSIEVQPGRITGLIGPNGSGKSSLINVISGVQKATRGTVHLDGRCLDGMDAGKRAKTGVARTFQANRLFPGLSVMDNAVLGATRLFGSSYTGSVLRTRKARREWRQQRERAESILATFGTRLLPRLDHPVSSLSYANRRRVEITRALMLHPSLLLLDEPMAGMNPHETWELAEQLPALMRTAECAVLLVEHKMDVIVELCPWVYVLDHGQALAEGSPDDVQNKPEVVEAFLGVE